MRSLAVFDLAAQPHLRLIVACALRSLGANDRHMEAMLFDRGCTLMAGSLKECRRSTNTNVVGVRPEMIDRADAVIASALVDAHMHPLMLDGMMTWADCGPEKVSSILGIVALLQEVATAIPADRPVRGCHYEHRNLAGGRHLTWWELEAVDAGRELYLVNASMHGGVSSFTLDRDGVTEDVPDPLGRKFVRNAQRELIGGLLGPACDIRTGSGRVKIGHHGPNFHSGDDSAEHLHHRTDHCGLSTAQQIKRMARTGIRPISQIQHHFNWSEAVQHSIGSSGARVNPFGESWAAPVLGEAIQAAATQITRRVSSQRNGGVLGPCRGGSVFAGMRARYRFSGSGQVRRLHRVRLRASDWPLGDISSIRILETRIDGERAHKADERGKS